MRWAAAIAACLWVDTAAGQVRNLPFSLLYRLEGERAALIADSGAVTSFYPMNASRVSLDTAFHYTRARKYYFAYQEKLLRDPLVLVKGEDFCIGIDPLFDFRFGVDMADTTAYADSVKLTGNTRGLRIEVDLGKNVSIQTSVYESQSFLPQFLRTYATESGVVPGMGRHKPFKENGFDYSASYGWIVWRVWPWLMLEAGQGKHFIGNGYRSVLLSDAAFNYPYIKATLESPNRKWAYRTVAAKLQTLERQPKGEVPESLFKRKDFSFHYLTYRPGRWLEVGLYESAVYRRYDEVTGTIAPDWPRWVPLIGVASARYGEEGLRSDYMRTGLNLNGGTKCIRVYCQVEGGTQAQLGLKVLDLPLRGLIVQGEMNSSGAVRMNAPNGLLLSYDHLNENLAHPAEGSAREWLVLAHLHRKRWLGMAKYNQITRQGSSFGDDPGDEYMGVLELQTGYLINPNSGLGFRMGLLRRLSDQRSPSGQTTIVYWSLCTALWQSYSDF